MPHTAPELEKGVGIIQGSFLNELRNEPWWRIKVRHADVFLKTPRGFSPAFAEHGREVPMCAARYKPPTYSAMAFNSSGDRFFTMPSMTAF